MKHSDLAFVGFVATTFGFGSFGCSRPSVTNKHTDAVVGTWLVKDAAAPFPYHMYVFNADGTMQQANPDAGDPSSSDSDGKGAWIADREKIRGKWVEVTADRVTRQFIGRGEYSFEIAVNGNRFGGSSVFRFYDANGALAKGPINDSLAGERVTLP